MVTSEQKEYQVGVDLAKGPDKSIQVEVFTLRFPDFTIEQLRYAHKIFSKIKDLRKYVSIGDYVYMVRHVELVEVVYGDPMKYPHLMVAFIRHILRKGDFETDEVHAQR